MLDARQGRRKLIYIMFKAVYHRVLYLNALIKEAQLGPRAGGGGGATHKMMTWTGTKVPVVNPTKDPKQF